MNKAVLDLLRSPIGGTKVSYEIGTLHNHPARDSEGAGIIVLYSKNGWDNIGSKPNIYYYKAQSPVEKLSRGMGMHWVASNKRSLGF